MPVRTGPLKDMHQIIMDCLREAGPDGLTTVELVDVIGARRPTKELLTDNTLYTHLCNMKREEGIAVERVSVYRLVPRRPKAVLSLITSNGARANG